MNDVKTAAVAKFRAVYGREPEVAAYAPGRVEILGNHTDYNEGYVLSAAINFGTYFLVAPRTDGLTRLTAGDLMETVEYDTANPVATKAHGWSNYVKGVQAGLNVLMPPLRGVDALFFGNIPLGAGLSSSAALEVSAGLALSRMFGMDVEALAMAKIAQQAEHRFAGVKCGLMDQMTSLFGKHHAMVWSDFRTLSVQTVPVGKKGSGVRGQGSVSGLPPAENGEGEICFLLCNTNARHALVDGAYNERRATCEKAAHYFDSVLAHPVRALRDVSWAEWEAHRQGLDDLTARRAAHPIGENERVLSGVEALQRGDVKAFGQLMYASHESSRNFFENSCPELDTLVEASRSVPGVFGARLTGGGFGGSVVVMTTPADAERVSTALRKAYTKTYGELCDTRVVVCSEGAKIVIND